ncbi:uncharacterized protein LOC110729313 [Chenopodium quinoa]|uniref:uncharacterized protein LOC110729313 n=1 Tax=Chenopodium quinoa TaxID=63459 RepID=UPI000B7738FE|nr:uncharacterized protein LOC110729313 [Chenopodium quinoa]
MEVGEEQLIRTEICSVLVIIAIISIIFFEAYNRRFNNSHVEGEAIFEDPNSLIKIFYLDHLSRILVSWGEAPRIKMWSQDEICKAIHQDKFESGDYGRLLVSIFSKNMVYSIS